MFVRSLNLFQKYIKNRLADYYFFTIHKSVYILKSYTILYNFNINLIYFVSKLAAAFIVA